MRERVRIPKGTRQQNVADNRVYIERKFPTGDEINDVQAYTFAVDMIAMGFTCPAIERLTEYEEVGADELLADLHFVKAQRYKQERVRTDSRLDICFAMFETWIILGAEDGQKNSSSPDSVVASGDDDADDNGDDDDSDDGGDDDGPF